MFGSQIHALPDTNIKIHKLQHHNFLTRGHLYKKIKWFKSYSNLKIGDLIQQRDELKKECTLELINK